MYAHAYGEYISRLPFDIKSHEVTPAKAKSSAQVKAQEGRDISAILTKLAPEHIVALDERGKDMTSQQFAADMERARDNAQHIAYVIGGAYGLDDALLKSAHNRISLGRMTLPHMLVRVILAEQIYRAHTIMNNHPYHK